MDRSAGLLLHPTSLPGGHGVGDLGAYAYAWVDFLVAAKQGLWQVLPLGPTGYGDSPYQSFSAFAGNPNLISLDGLLEQGFLTATDLEDAPANTGTVDYGTVIPFKDAALRRAAEAFQKVATEEQQGEFRTFCDDRRTGWTTTRSLWP